MLALLPVVQTVAPNFKLRGSLSMISTQQKIFSLFHFFERTLFSMPTNSLVIYYLIAWKNMMGYATIKRFLTAQMFQITPKIFKPRSCLWLVAVKNHFVSNDVQTFSENCEKNMTGTIFPGHVSITLARNFHFVAFITFSAGQKWSFSHIFCNRKH